MREVVAAGRDPRDDAAGRDRRAAAEHARRRHAARRGVPLPRGARPRAGRRCSRTAGSSASSRGRCCSAGWPRTSRRPRTGSSSSSRCRRRAARRPLRARAARPPRARRRGGCRARSPRSRRGRRSRAPRDRIAAPATITGARPGSTISRALRDGSAASRASLLARPAHARSCGRGRARGRTPRARGRARRASSRCRRRRPPARRVACGSRPRDVRRGIAATSSPKRSVSRTQPTSRLARTSVPTIWSSVEPPPMSTTSVPGSSAPIAAQRQRGLLVAAQQARREAVAPLDLAEEGLAVLGVAHGARRDAERPLGSERLELAPVRRRGRCGRARSGRGAGGAARRRPRRAG